MTSLSHDITGPSIKAYQWQTVLREGKGRRRKIRCAHAPAPPHFQGDDLMRTLPPVPELGSDRQVGLGTEVEPQAVQMPLPVFEPHDLLGLNQYEKGAETQHMSQIESS